MNWVPLIERKRDGGELTDGEIRDLIAGYVAGEMPDYQMCIRDRPSSSSSTG